MPPSFESSFEQWQEKKEKEGEVKRRTSEMLYLLESGQVLEFEDGCRVICLSSDEYIGTLCDKYDESRATFSIEDFRYKPVEEPKIEFLILANPNNHSLVGNMTPGYRIKANIKELATMYIKKEFKIPKHYAKDRSKIEDIWKKTEEKQ